MAVSKEQLERELKKALKEIGGVKPRWSAKDKMYVFEHPAYPFVDYLAPTKEEVIEKYPLVLREFIKDRLTGKIALPLEKITSGRGGYRPGAGRPRKAPTMAKRLPKDIAMWLDDEKNLEKVRKLMGKGRTA